MRVSELFGRTLRSPSGASGSRQTLAERAGLARFHPDGTVWLPLGERVTSRLQSSLVRSLSPAGWPGMAPAAQTTGWADTVQAEIQSYRQMAVRLAAERRLVATLGAHTIELLASALGIERTRTLEAVFLTHESGDSGSPEPGAGRGRGQGPRR